MIFTKALSNLSQFWLRMVVIRMVCEFSYFFFPFISLVYAVCLFSVCSGLEVNKM